MTNRVRADVPPVEQLRELVERPLAELEKIPIPETMFEALVSVFDARRCTTDAAHSLFKVGELDVNLLHIYSAVLKSAPDNGTEYSFVSFWDHNIRDILQSIVPTGHAIRNSNLFTSTKLYCPDFGFLLKQLCPFRGEEKGGEDRKDPKAELVNKLVWMYDPAPYILGYYCKPGCHDIISVNLKLRKDRIANVRHLINLSPLLPLLANLAPSRLDDFHNIWRPNSTIRLDPVQVIKSFHGELAEQKVQHLERVYEILEQKSIPNTDKLV
ncbi:hypothetical protein EDC04DRAFT_2889346 [Pisolithus marmoratus]|nr:hypothetical protein EDC04DRAFT_2889346 [Pisolithus marmoratus]